MRIETVINHPRDLGCNARLRNLDDLQVKARACNRRILDAERVGQGRVLASPAFERIAHPNANAAGGRTPALRFGDPRVMALTGALCHTLLAATGFTNKSLRVLIAGLLGSDYRPNQMTYDLRRLRLHGLIRRLPRTNRYMLTDDGIRIAVFYTKIYNRTLLPLTAADQPQAVSREATPASAADLAPSPESNAGRSDDRELHCALHGCVLTGTGDDGAPVQPCLGRRRAHHQAGRITSGLQPCGSDHRTGPWSAGCSPA